MSYPRLLLNVLLMCAVTATAARAQQASVLEIRVVDATNAAVAGAELRLRRIAEEGEMRSVTARDGVAFFRGVPAGSYIVRSEALGYTAREDTMSVGPGTVLKMEVQLLIAPVPLPGVDVEGTARPPLDAMSGFWLRRSQGIGNFLTRDEIDRLRPQKTADIFRRIPEARIELFGYAPVAVFNRTRDIQGRPCLPAMFLDGVPYAMTDRGLDDFNPDAIEAIEIYSGSARIPAIFNSTGSGSRSGMIVGSPRCGAIAIWTRRAQRR